MATLNSRTVKRPIQVDIPVAEKQWINPAENPESANETIKKILDETTSEPLPEIGFPQADIVNLPGGLSWKDELIRTVEVRELTGEDEESLAKASKSSNIFSFMDRLLRCGVARIGSENTPDNDKKLSQMLIGDREAVLLGIRRATYGDEIEIKDWQCSVCTNKADLTLELDDIPSTKLDYYAEQGFDVSLRKGGLAKCHLATGADQLAVFEDDKLTVAEQQTILLSRCIVSIIDKNGIEKSMSAFPSMSRSLSLADRHNILKELDSRQPGPKYNQVSFTCENCNSEQRVAITIGHLFLEFGWI